MNQPDVAAVFASDDHRRVLGHLGVPGDEMAWNYHDLYLRMIPDVGSDLSEAEIGDILLDLQADGLAEFREDETWQMTPLGFDRLTGGVVAEDAEPGPAIINEGV